MSSAAASSKRVPLADDVPWRASPVGNKPVPRIHQNPILRLPQNSTSSYALSVMKHPNPIGEGLAMEASLEAAGPECIIPGQIAPVRILGLKDPQGKPRGSQIQRRRIEKATTISTTEDIQRDIWPIDINFKFMEPVTRELQSMGKLMDSALNLMNASFEER